MIENFVTDITNSWLASSVFVAIVFVLLAEWVYFACLGRRYLADGSKEQLIQRLEAYAALKREGSDQPICRSVSAHKLSPMGHEILLGTLKKVEQKSATLTTIIVFALTISLGAILAGGRYSYIDLILIVLCLGLLPPLLGAFRGIRQVDQREYLNNGKFQKVVDAANHLQDQLLDDLLEKERAFNYSKSLSLLLVFALVISMSLMAILGALGTKLEIEPSFKVLPIEARQ